MCTGEIVLKSFDLLLIICACMREYLVVLLRPLLDCHVGSLDDFVRGITCATHHPAKTADGSLPPRADAGVASRLVQFCPGKGQLWRADLSGHQVIWYRER
ncbi:hypothetical protein B0H11DRAFT_2268839 [Mycena galericulata]|nr:hypothetical protein B0H11DRAFT_2268839 [Mycena galericulata]